MHSEQFESGDDVVRMAEGVLRDLAWHRIIVDHGPLEITERSRARRSIMTIAVGFSEDQACEMTFEDESFTVTVGPPGSGDSASTIEEAIGAMNPGSWKIRRFLRHV